MHVSNPKVFHLQYDILVISGGGPPHSSGSLETLSMEMPVSDLLSPLGRLVKHSGSLSSGSPRRRSSSASPGKFLSWV